MEARIARRRLVVRGTVQGVGFRPHVYSVATSLGLSGQVFNDPNGVVIEVEGATPELDEFLKRLIAALPPLALVEGIESRDVDPRGTVGFQISASRTGGAPTAAVSPDVATCAACLDELFDPDDRRYRYPFINCTNCGPRFTITTGIPYDRPNTTMARFDMCGPCAAEYEDPRDRRFHAQPIACPTCGPHLRIKGGDGIDLPGDPLDTATMMLLAGGIVAVKGIGGFHLACDATNDRAVRELRARKHREEKPFAVMVRDEARAEEIVHLEDTERSLLGSPQRPIVLAARRDGIVVADAVAPGNRYLGVMLAYSPLHHLLLEGVRRPLVMTSGNVSDEPIAYRNAEALERLSDIADAFVIHDRPIHMRCDDSVVRAARDLPYPIRRARGFAPEPLTVPLPFPRPVLGAGGELKHTFCLGAGTRAIVSHHIGDLENLESMQAFVGAVEHFTRVFAIRPQVVAHDLHPEYLSTKWARDLADVEVVGVQHHHAHIASCLADNSRSEAVIGLALDGTGYGDDGTLWGCEVMVADLASYRRVLHLAPVPLPGGAAAVRQPWRMAAVYLERAFEGDAGSLDLPFVHRTHDRRRPILAMAARGINSPQTSSAGRLFDAVAALCGLRDEVTYEGQAAAELEQAADPRVLDGYACNVAEGTIDGAALFRAAALDLARGSDVARVAARFHNGLAGGLVRACEIVRDNEGLHVVALSGGTFQNVLLLSRVRSQLEQRGFEVLVHRRVPCNDGGISLGQAVVAAAQGEQYGSSARAR